MDPNWLRIDPKCIKNWVNMSKWTKIDEKYFKNGRNQVEKVPKFDETWIQNIYRNDPKVSIKLIKIGLEINQKPINKRSKIISKTEYNEEIFVHSSSQNRPIYTEMQFYQFFPSSWFIFFNFEIPFIFWRSLWFVFVTFHISKHLLLFWFYINQ